MGRNFTDSVMQKPVEAPDVAAGLSSGVKAGIDLATAADQVEQKKAQTEAMKLDLMEKKFTAFDSRLKNLNRANPAIKKQMGERIKEQFQAMGFDPLIVDAVLADPEMGRFYQNLSDVHLGKIKGNSANLTKALQSAEDAGQFTEMLTVMKNRQAVDQQDKQMVSNERIAGMNKEAKADKAGAQVEKDFKQALRLEKNKFEEIIKKDREAMGSLNDANNLLSTGGPIEQSAARRALAKAYNSGALTDNDVNDFAGDKALAERLKQALSTGLTGEITENNLNQLMQIAQKSYNRRKSTVEANAADAANRFSYVYGGDKEEILKNVFMPSGFLGASSLEKKAPGVENPDAPKEQAGKQPKPKFDPIAFKAQQIKAGKTPAQVDAFLKTKGY